MTIRYYLLIFIFFAALLSLGSFIMTRAYFSDTAVSASNIFSTAHEFGDEDGLETSPNEIQPGKVVINEVSPVGGDSVDWVEIFNGTSSELNLKKWSIEDNNEKVNIPDLDFILQPNKYAVIVASGSGLTVNLPALKVELTGIIGGGLNPTSDKIILRDASNQLIDQVSWGSNSSVFSGVTSPTGSASLRRIPNGHDTDTAADWQVGTPSLGGSN